MNRDAARVSALLFFSGASALIYQTVWLRQFRLIFGGSTFATAAVLAIFMAGLGLGSAVLGKRADATDRPLAYYARLELWIALAAASSPFLLLLAARLYFASGGSPRLGLVVATLLRLVLAVVVLGPATFLMGGTLPAAARAVGTHTDSSRRAVALLYGVNALGAIAGTLLSSFLLLEQLGNRQTLWVAVLVNVLVALTAARMRMRTAVLTPEPADSTTSDASPLPRRLVYAAAATVGFAFLLMELVWYRMLSPILGGTTYMFTLVLAIALAGIASGGLLYAFTMRRAASAAAFAITCTLEALAIALPFAAGDRLALLANALRQLGGLGFIGHLFAWTMVTAIVVFPTAVIAGVQFPLLIALLGRGRDALGGQIGAAYAWNSVGAIAGSLAGGFGLMPLLTAPGVWRLVVVLLVILGLAPVFAMRDPRTSRRSVAGVAALLAIVCILTPGPTAVWRHSGIGGGRASIPATRNGLQRWIHEVRRTTAWERDGRESSVALSIVNDTSFLVNGKSDGAARGDAGTQVMAGIIPAVLHANPATALVVGLGTGSTAGWLAAIPGMEHVDVVELEPVVLDVARACTAVNANAMQNPRLHVSIGDAREVLLASERQYDVIASEPSNPYRAGVASLFTTEFYRAAHARLNRGGIFAQWVQSYGVDAETIRTIYATITGVFPHVQTWWTTTGDVMLVASADPLTIDMEKLRARLATEPYRSAAINTWRVGTAEGFVGHLFANEDFARAAASHARFTNSDDRTVIEFGFARTIDSSGTLQEQLRSDAESMGATHPEFVRGAIDWNAVERNRPWVSQTASATDPGLIAERALEEAGKGDPAAEADARLVTQSIEADFIIATLREKQGRPDEATALLGRAFRAYRGNPWPDPKLMTGAFDLARDLSLTSPDRARLLFEALSTPFAARQHETLRLFTRIVVAPLFDRCGSKTIQSLHAVEPHPMWQSQILTIRANCYGMAGDDRARKAWDDLQQFAAAEQGYIVPPPRAPSPEVTQ